MSQYSPNTEIIAIPTLKQQERGKDSRKMSEQTRLGSKFSASKCHLVYELLKILLPARIAISLLNNCHLGLLCNKRGGVAGGVALQSKIMVVIKTMKSLSSSKAH